MFHISKRNKLYVGNVFVLSKVAPQSDDSVVELIQTKLLKTVFTHVVKVVVIIILDCSYNNYCG